MCSCPLDGYNDTILSLYLSIGNADKCTILLLSILYNESIASIDNASIVLDIAILLWYSLHGKEE